MTREPILKLPTVLELAETEERLVTRLVIKLQEAEKKIAALEAEIERLRKLTVDM